MISLTEKKFEEAIAQNNKAMEINPDNIEARYQRAIVFALQKRYEEALAENMAVLEKNPKHANAAYNIGVLNASPRFENSTKSTFLGRK